jgi:hypothetical protein
MSVTAVKLTSSVAKGDKGDQGPQGIQGLGERGDKLSYGHKMSKTLSKLLNASTDDIGKAQNKFDNTVKIIHLGDSVAALKWSSTHLLTGVTGTTDGNDFVGLNARFPFANFHVTNSAIGGQAAQHFKNTMWHSVIPYDPDLVMIHTYGNDSMANPAQNTQEFYSSYEEIVKYLRKHTTADIAICSYHLYPQNYDTVANSAGHKILELLSQKYDCEFIDIARFMRDFGASQTTPFYSTAADIQEWYNRGYFLLNDTHPPAKGQKVLAQAVFQHFPDINDKVTNFNWNGPITRWAQREPVIQAESVLEFLDNNVRLSSEAAWEYGGETDSSDSRLCLASVSSSANNEYIEFDFEGNAIDLVYVPNNGGAIANITIDGVTPQSLSKNSLWYPYADTANFYQTGSGSRDATIRYIPSKWTISELITITFTGTAGQVSLIADITGSVSGTIATGVNINNLVKITSGSNYLWLRPENWTNRGVNIKTGDKFYIPAYNAQAIPLDNMQQWDVSTRLFPLIDVSDSLDDEYIIRFYMTSSTAFSVDRVSRADRNSDTSSTNVVTAIGTGTLSDSGFTSGIFSITQAELIYITGKIASGNKFYYWVHRRWSNTINCSSGGSGSQYKKIRLASGMNNGIHTVRITKTGTGKLYIDALRPFNPPLKY